MKLTKGSPETDAPIPMEENPLKIRLIAIGLSFVVGTLLMGAKFYIFRLTGSAAVLSDALESIINVVASAFAFFSIWVAARPPDPNHPYGHGKIEYFSAGFEGALIVLAAFSIFRSGIPRIFAPQPLMHLSGGLMLLLATSGINLILGVGLLRTGRKTDSLALIADGRHILTDVYTSVGVLLGLLLVSITGWLWVDGAIACLVGINVLVTGSRLMRESFGGLMDETDPVLLNRIADIIITHRRDSWIDIHQLRSWRSGAHVNIDLHLLLPKDMSLEDAHGEAEHLEEILITHFDGRASILVHTDPCNPSYCPICRQDSCEHRVSSPAADYPWTLASLTMVKSNRSSKSSG